MEQDLTDIQEARREVISDQLCSVVGQCLEVGFSEDNIRGLVEHVLKRHGS